MTLTFLRYRQIDILLLLYEDRSQLLPIHANVAIQAKCVKAPIASQTTQGKISFLPKKIYIY